VFLSRRRGICLSLLGEVCQLSHGRRPPLAQGFDDRLEKVYNKSAGVAVDRREVNEQCERRADIQGLASSPGRDARGTCARVLSLLILWVGGLIIPVSRCARDKISTNEFLTLSTVMKALILAGGEGTRLRPMTYSVPKVMAPLANVPFLEAMISWICQHGIRDIVLAICYKPELISDYFGDGSRLGARIAYVVEKEPLGTGGAIKNCEDLLDSPFFVFNGDILTDLDLTDMARRHADRRAEASISLTWVEDPTIYGVVETDGDAKVRRFLEKPALHEATSHFINAGTYILEPHLLARMPAGQPLSIERDFYPQALSDGARIFAYPSGGYWLDIGTAAKYLKAHRDILDGVIRLELPGRHSSKGITVGEGCELRGELHPPALLGSNCVVERGARIGPYAVLGDSVVVAKGAVVEHSVLWRGCSVQKGVLVCSSVVGFDTRVPAGCQLVDAAVGEKGHGLSSPRAQGRREV